MELPYDPVIPLLGTYSEKTRVQKDTCIPLFTVAQFTIVRTWNQPKFPPTEKWIKMCYVHTMKCYSAIKQNDLLINTACMNLENIMLSGRSQSQKNLTLYDFVYMRSLE